MTEREKQEQRLASARELVARYPDGHELSADELAKVVEAGLLGELFAATGATPLWTSKNDTTENQPRGGTDARATSKTRSIP